MTDLAGTVAAFRDRFGAEPDGVWSAPGRVNLIGEHTDYNRGLVLPLAVDRRTWAAVRVTGSGVVRAVSTAQPETASAPLAAIGDATFDGWAGYALGIPWALARLGHDLSAAPPGHGQLRPPGRAEPQSPSPGEPRLPGLDILVDSDVPLGAGLSSSAAIETAIATALNDLWQLGLERLDLARVGQLAENGAVGAPTGIMDQAAVLLGAADHAVLIDCDVLSTRLVPLPLAGGGLALLVIETGVRHSHATGGYGERRAACEAAAARLGLGSLRELEPDGLLAAQALLDDEQWRRTRHVVTENARVLQTVALLETAGPRAVGDLLVASHASMRDDFEISVPEIDTAVEAALAAGALGARLTGGGFGGAAIALVEAENAAGVGAAVRSAFADRGFAAPDILEVRPADGARREA